MVLESDPKLAAPASDRSILPTIVPLKDCVPPLKITLPAPLRKLVEP